MVAREYRLQKALRKYLDENPIDVVLIDCPPSLGLLTLNALVAAEEILIPIQCEYYALEGLGQLIRTVEMVKQHLNPELAISAILLTMTDSRTRLSDQVADEVRAFFGDLVLSTAIPRSVRLSEAPGYGRSGLAYDPKSPGALAYRRAAEELTGTTIDLTEATAAVQA
jgi:chromosome partitioning protein